MKQKVTCWDRKDGETVFSQICESKKDAQDLIDCETERRENRFEWSVNAIEKKLTPVSFGPDGKDRHYLPL